VTDAAAPLTELGGPQTCVTRTASAHRQVGVGL